MKIYDDTTKVLDFLDYTSDNKLRKRQDIAVILESGATFGVFNLVNDIIINAAGLYNMDAALKKSKATAEASVHLFNELHNTGKRVQTMLKNLIAYFEEPDAARFNAIYLAETNGAIRNLVDLGHDCSQFKKMQSFVKTNSTEEL